MQPRLTTQRMVLTPLTAEDGPRLAVIFAGAGVRRYLFDNEDVSPETVTTIVADNMRRATEGLGLWLIAADGAVIGCIGLHRALPSTVKAFPPLDGEIELVIALMEDHWGAGYASEALTTALTYASDILHARRIVVLIDVPNERSHALFQRCGFKEIGSCRSTRPSPMNGRRSAGQRGRTAAARGRSDQRYPSQHHSLCASLHHQRVGDRLGCRSVRRGA